MIEPATIDLACFTGADYTDVWTFFADQAQTVPFDFTGWTGFSLELGTLTLTEGSGLTIDHAAGTIAPFVARTVTAALAPGSVRYALAAIDPDDHLGYLLHGGFKWSSVLTPVWAS
jgi:hypothetical protein